MSGTYAFWFLAISAWCALLSVLIKLKWWRFSLGYWLIFVLGALVFICGFIFLLQTDTLPVEFRDQARFIIYGTLGLAIFLLVVDIWRKNWHHWAWTKEE